MELFFSKKCLEYYQPGHPESPDRIAATHEFLTKKGYTFLESRACTDADILRVHTMDHLESVKKGTFIDYDTPHLPSIYHYALLAAGSAIQAVESASQGESAFSLMRPPGHHATRNRVMGFCYFNNIAVAAAAYLHKYTEARVAILDIDCHHGNGTEDIFLRDPSVLYISLHQSPLYPGTGHESHKNCINYPLLPGTDSSEYLTVLDKACEKISKFEPTLLGVSAGFDTYLGDPLTQLHIPANTYHSIGQMIARLKQPTFMVMEGGYSSDLPECVYQFLMGFSS